MFQSEKSSPTPQTETTEPHILYTQNTGTPDSTQSVYLELPVKNLASKRPRRYIKPLATMNDISFVVIDKDILDQLQLNDSKGIELEEEVTQDRKGILLRIREK